MRTVAFVTYAALPDGATDDRLVQLLLESRKISVEVVSWDDPKVDWRVFDAVILRSCWDYHLRADEFRHWLTRLEHDHVNVQNASGVVHWNMDKHYLRDLSSYGIPIPSTQWFDRGSSANLQSILCENGWERAVVKPRVSATAFQTWTVAVDEAASAQGQFNTMVHERGVLVQEFLDAIESEGEWSLMYFAKRWSHAVLKRPRAGDFRVQDEWGGSVEPASPPPSVLAQAQRIVDRLPFPLLYLRLDGVVVANRFIVMELEAIEPSLFLATASHAAERFAQAIWECVAAQ
jgi:glutathione synthase/RimK-type ligase-like ATP-grasp enzyme